jgi:mRNA interferase RelE/StbE
MKKQDNESSQRKSSTYTITIKERALKALKKLPANVASKIDEKIQALAQNPRPDGCKKLEGYSNAYRIRYSDYRVVYTIQNHALIIEVVHIGNRKDIYKHI